MSLYWFAAVGTPIMLGVAGLFVFVFTGWQDRRDRARAEQR